MKDEKIEFCPHCTGVMNELENDLMCELCLYKKSNYNAKPVIENKEILNILNDAPKKRARISKSTDRATITRNVKDILIDFDGDDNKHKTSIYVEFERRNDLYNWGLGINNQGRVRYQHTIDGILTSLKDQGLVDNYAYTGRWFATNLLLNSVDAGVCA